MNRRSDILWFGAVFPEDGEDDPMWLLGRALVAFLTLPGLVAFVIPGLIARPLPDRLHAYGLVPFVAGIALLGWCVVAFYRQGRGTLAPWDPPTALVVTGIYGLSRNPMYVAVVLILCGWALGVGSWTLAVYAGAIAIAFHLRVVFGEEPWLSRQHGERWTRYQARVPRWLGRIR